MFRQSSFNPRMIVTTITFCLFIRLSSSQYWCPGSSVPAPCCSKLLNGSITPDYARSDVKLLKPMYGYHDVKGGQTSISKCYDECKVGVCYISLQLIQYCSQGIPFVRSDCSFFFLKKCFKFSFRSGLSVLRDIIEYRNMANVFAMFCQNIMKMNMNFITTKT